MARSRQKPGHFTPELFRFLRALRQNNDREWFQKNKDRYLEHVRDPLLAFIAEFGPRLRKINPHFVADPRPVGGSMFRIYRDVRFSRNKAPYKTSATAQFRYGEGKDVHVPCFYLHLGADQCYAGAGLWRPDSPTLSAVRKTIAENPGLWKKAHSGKRFREIFTPGGESLKRPPRGFAPDHPLIEDLKRKDFVVSTPFEERDVCGPDFMNEFARVCRTGAPYVAFLTRAVGLKW